MDRKKSIAILTRLSQDDTTALDSRNYELFTRFVKVCVDNKYISKSEASEFAITVQNRQKKLFKQVLRDENGKVIIWSTYKDGRLLEQPATWEMVLEYDTDEKGNNILGTHRIKNGDLTQTDASGKTVVLKPAQPIDSSAYKAYRAEMFRQHKERMAQNHLDARSKLESSSKQIKTVGANYKQLGPFSTVNPLFLFLTVLLGSLSGLWGQRKGYSFRCWMFAAPGSMLICFLILPFMKDVNQEPASERAKIIRTGNVTGIALSIAYPVILTVLYIGLMAGRQ